MRRLRASTDKPKFNYKLFSFLFLLAPIFWLSGCTEDMWNRGQTPAPDTLLKRANEQFESTFHLRAAERHAVARSFVSGVSVLNNAVKAHRDGKRPSAELARLRTIFLELEGNLAYGSRPAFGELSGQLRVLIERVRAKEDLGPELELFAARTIFLWSSDLNSPAPGMS